MKCPECVEAGQRSRVYEGGTVVTAMAGQSFYDEDGLYHHHDPNWRTTSYSCSNGHRWADSSKFKCANCNYNVDEVAIV